MMAETINPFDQEVACIASHGRPVQTLNQLIIWRMRLRASCGVEKIQRYEWFKEVCVVDG